MIVDIRKEGPKVLMDIPPRAQPKRMNLNDFALIDEISGLNRFMDNFLRSNDMPQTTRERIQALMFKYNSEKPKERALNELRQVFYGSGR